MKKEYEDLLNKGFNYLSELIEKIVAIEDENCGEPNTLSEHLWKYLGDFEEEIRVITFDLASCLDCGEEFRQERDLQICDTCIDKYDTDRLWKDHDENKIDALDFNENAKMREAYKK